MMKSLFYFLKPDTSENYKNMAMRVAHMSIQASSRLAIQLTPPDILAELPMDSFGLFDFSKAAAASKCPKCGAEAVQVGTEGIRLGKYLDTSFKVPVKVKVVFFNVSITLTITVKYCANCGYLAVSVKQV